MDLEYKILDQTHSILVIQRAISIFSQSKSIYYLRRVPLLERRLYRMKNHLTWLIDKKIQQEMIEFLNKQNNNNYASRTIHLRTRKH